MKRPSDDLTLSKKGQQKPRAIKKASRRVGPECEVKKAAPVADGINDGTVKSLKEAAGF